MIHVYSVFIENHDQSRVVSRFGNDSKEWRTCSAKLFALLIVAQGGTLFIYQGQELGLKNFPASWGLDEYKDVATINFWNRLVFSFFQKYTPDSPRVFFFYTFVEPHEFGLTFQLVSYSNRIKERRRAEAQPGEEIDMSDILGGLQLKARDHSRVPMPVRKLSLLSTNHINTGLTFKHAPRTSSCSGRGDGFLVQWTADPHAGFTTGTPWMRVNDDYADGWNVQAQLGDNASVHAFYQHVLGYRKKSDLLVSPIRSITPRLYSILESKR